MVEVQVNVDTRKTWFTRVLDSIAVDIKPLETGRSARWGERSEVGGRRTTQSNCNALGFFSCIRCLPSRRSNHSNGLDPSSGLEGITTQPIRHTASFTQIQQTVVVRVGIDLPSSQSHFARFLARVAVHVVEDDTGDRTTDRTGRHTKGHYIGAVVPPATVSRVNRRKLVIAETERIIIPCSENPVQANTDQARRWILIHHRQRFVERILVHASQIMPSFVCDRIGDNFREYVCNRCRTRNRNRLTVYRKSRMQLSNYQCGFFAVEVTDVDRFSYTEQTGDGQTQFSVCTTDRNP